MPAARDSDASARTCVTSGWWASILAGGCAMAVISTLATWMSDGRSWCRLLVECAWSSVLGRFELLIVHWSIQRFLVRQWVRCCQSTKALVLFPLQRNAWSSVVHAMRQSPGAFGPTATEALFSDPVTDSRPALFCFRIQYMFASVYGLVEFPVFLREKMDYGS